ncbi:MAG: BREX protein BrxB domain-containing protein, partial [Bacillota bacterium]
YREAYFAQPELLSPAIDDFFETLLGRLRHSLDSSDDNTVVALVGSGSLFGITQVSSIVAGIADAIAGRLLVFFPGTREGSNYRLLDARDGWNYRAVPIEATEKGE